MFGWLRRRDDREELIVDNRVFAIGLDGMVRTALGRHEKGELLACAAEVAKALGIGASSSPVEGNYTEDPDRARYFSLMRALQGESMHREREVAHMAEFQRLMAVTSSRIFGLADRDGKLLPRGKDALSQAMETSPLTVKDLTAAAAIAAERSDDISLVGVAARTKDAVCLAATRETCVLYAKVYLGAVPQAFDYTWRVDPSVCTAAKLFLRQFCALFGDVLPEPEPGHAKDYFDAYQSNQVTGRCVCLAAEHERYYHWAIVADGADSRVEEFWDSTLWTTERFRATRPPLGSP
ncbi:MAG TPA: hypothetical protein VFQ61_19205 [Polyangiaceae bacterium]|nr:hypothetical protein [Polyangiaceae bacterium]